MKFLLSQKLISFDGDKIKRSREIIEIEKKLKILGIIPNWENY